MEFRKIGIIGTGLMGGGIAQVCAQAGYETASYDLNEATFDRTQGMIRSSMDKMLARGKFTPEYVKDVLDRMSYTTDITRLSDCDIVVEAVFENLDVKLNVLKQVEAVVSNECLVFSNTSALSITTLSTALKYPGRFMGTHFFSPVPAMKLVELVIGMDTTEDTYEKAARWVESIKKISVRAPDTSGFITNRLLPAPEIAMAPMVELGVSPTSIDACYQLLTEAPIGTLELADMSGLDVSVGCMQSVYDGLGDEVYHPQAYIKKLIAAGRLGAKSGQGFYQWQAGKIVKD